MKEGRGLYSYSSASGSERERSERKLEPPTCSIIMSLLGKDSGVVVCVGNIAISIVFFVFVLSKLSMSFLVWVFLI